MAEDYKTAKVEFVSNQSGSSVAHINLISTVALSSIALHSALRSRLPPTKCLNLFTEYLLLILPLLFSMTIFADKPLILDAILLFPTGLLLLIPARSRQSLPSSRPPSPTSQQRSNALEEQLAIKITPLPALTTYRTHMLIMTFLAILAVDFPVFPRNLAKCETFGVSLMDMGVGSFVFSQGVVSAIPLIKNPAHISAPLLPKLKAVALKMLPILFLGVVRVLLVKGTDYPEHESEYGTHWNFFLTLAALPILQVLLHPVLLHSPIMSVGIGITLFHQSLMSQTTLQSWTLYSPRTDIISQNKEGLVSLPGYLAIHVLGLLTGTVLLPSSPSDFRRVQQSIRQNSADTHAPGIDLKPRPRQDLKTAIELCSYAAVWWSLLGLGSLMGFGGGVSRRLANTRYVFWVAAYNTSFVTGYLVLDLFFYPPFPERKTSPAFLSPTASSPAVSLPELDNPPPRKAAVLLEAINFNGLALFLIANIGTGLVNMVMRTMYASDVSSMVILCLYAFGISAVAWIARDRRLWKM